MLPELLGQIIKRAMTGGHFGRPNLVACGKIAFPSYLKVTAPNTNFSGSINTHTSCTSHLRSYFTVLIIFKVKLSSAGTRLIVWDALSAEAALGCSRGLLPDAAVKQIVKEAPQSKELRDDTTCLVVDILPARKDESTCATTNKERSI